MSALQNEEKNAPKWCIDKLGLSKLDENECYSVDNFFEPVDNFGVNASFDFGINDVTSVTVVTL